ncbi:MAG TPA: PAS domain S-box protein, partial [Thermoplasmatales archaeon]|nr:PAS domain S-box protein [Thermoplasmatales archaeon]
KYRTIFETSPETIVLFDRNGYIIDANNRIKEWIGYDRDELLGKSIDGLPFLSPESKKVAMEKFSHRLHGEDVSAYDLEFLTKKGTVAFGRVRGTAMKDAEGNIVGTLVMISDVTEQKQFEEKLRENEEKFRAISTSAYDAIIMIDDSGNVTYWNKAAEKMFGYKEEEIIGKDLHMVLAPPKFHEAHKKAFKKFRETGRGAAVGKSMELSALCKDGTEFPVELSLSSVKIDGRWHAIGIVRDITERKRAEVELKEAYDKIETLLNAAADGIRIVNRDFKVTALNDTMAELAGVKKNEAVGMLCSDMFGSDDCGTQNCTMMRVLKSGKKIKSRTLRRRPDGKTVPCLHVATPLKDEKGDIVGIIEDFRDITELERVEINLAKAHYRLKHQNESLKRLNNLQKIFLNVTSHELRTPMAAIRGYADLLTLGTLGELNSEQKEALNVVRRNIDRLDNLIKDILDISRLESGTLSIQPTRCDLQEIIAEVLATMRFTAETKNINIETEVEKNLPPIYADRDRIKQVLINLLGNAIKLSKSGSRIILTVKRERDHVVLAVKDFGRGIPKNKQKKIFEPFYQVDSGMDRKFGGVGLGLAITKGIVLAHNGDITVESKVGKGSTFYVKLPFKPSFAKGEKRLAYLKKMMMCLRFRLNPLILS